MKDRESYAPFKFFLVAFVLSWAYWIPCALDQAGLLPFRLPQAVISFAGVGTLGPALAALLMVFRRGRRAGVLLASLRRWRVGWRWVAAATLIYPALLLVAGGLHNVMGGEPRLTPQPFSAASFVVLTVMLALTGFGEEIGWRGYALPALQSRWNALGASLILGTVVTVWHLPFWALQPSIAEYGWGYVGLNWIWILAATLFVTWLMNNTGNSVLLAVLFHWAVNVVNVGTLQVTGTIQSYLVLIVLCWTVAAFLLVVFGARRLAKDTAADAPQSHPGLTLPTPKV